jgi:hypothetical protein
MAKTLLNLKLSYKGKLLDIIKSGRDFDNSWYIGSNKYLFWQILDPNFPNKHLFLVKKGNDYFLQLVPGSNVSCSKNGNPVDASFLQQNGILKGTSLLLRNDMSGTVALNPEWEIKYEFTEPWVRVLTEEERMIVAQYSRRSELTASERFNRSLILLFIFLTVAFILVYDFVLKPETVDTGTLESKLAQLEQAQRVEPPPIQGQAPVEAGTAEGEATEVVEAPTGTQGTPGGTGAANASATFGNMSGTGTAAPGSPYQAATVRQSFVTASPGGRSGGGGSGPGGGPGAGSGFAGTFDPNATAGYNQTDLGQIAFGKTPGGGTSTRPTEGTVQVFTGDAGKIAPRGKPIAQSAQTAGVIRSFQAASVSTISEGSIASVAEEQRPDVEKISSSVNARKGQITQLYRQSAAVQASSGSITIKLYISDNGQVDAADVIPNSETFTTKFLQDVKNLVENWSFNVSKKTIYQFTLRLSQG